jgi:putative membrane protein
MKNFLLRVVINAFALAVIITLLPQGIRIEGASQGNAYWTLLGIALIFGIVNATVKPLLTLLACSFIVFTFGLFLLVINGALFMLTAWLSQQLLPTSGYLVVDGFGWAVVGALLMSIIGMVSEKIFGLDDRVRVKKVKEVRYVYRDRDDWGEPPQFPPSDDPYTVYPPENPPGGDRPTRR